jgi:hypothetical protein
VSVSRFVAQGLHVVDEFLAHRRVQVDPLGRDRRLEPLLVERLELAALHHRRERVVDQLLERRIVLPDHDRVRLDLDRLADHRELGRILRAGAQAVEQDVVHAEGDRAAGLHHQRRLGVVLRAEQVDAELLVLVELPDDLEVGRAGGRDDRLAGEIAQLVDIGAGLHQEARAGVEVVDRERDLLAALAVVGGRAALDVDRAVLQQRDAVGRGHGLVLELEVVAARRLLDVVGDLLADLVAEAGRLRVAAEVRERDRRFAVGERHRPALLDLVERRRLREGERRQAQREQAEGAEQGMGHERTSWRVRGKRRRQHKRCQRQRLATRLVASSLARSMP